MNELLRRASFSDSAITTVSPSRIVVMCFERIDRDLEGCVASMRASDRSSWNELACHAQDIIAELLSSLDQDAWEHAEKLASLYSWAMQQLIVANIKCDVKAVSDVRSVMAELRDAFTEAAAPVPTPANPAPGSLSAKA